MQQSDYSHVTSGLSADRSKGEVKQWRNIRLSVPMGAMHINETFFFFFDSKLRGMCVRACTIRKTIVCFVVEAVKVKYETEFIVAWDQMQPIKIETNITSSL